MFMRKPPIRRRRPPAIRRPVSLRKSPSPPVAVRNCCRTCPTSIIALSNKELADRQIFQVEDIATTIPSVHIVPQNGTPGIPQISIRGVTGGNIDAEVDSPIAMYIDGVYIARSTGASFDLADLERVEVLRGPQGTLFGRNGRGRRHKLRIPRPRQANMAVGWRRLSATMT